MNCSSDSCANAQVGALVAGGGRDKEWTASELVDRFIDPLVLVLLAIVIGIAIFCYISTRIYARKYPHLHLALTGTAKSADAEGDDGVVREHEIKSLPAVIRYQHVLLSAMVGTLTVVSAKVHTSPSAITHLSASVIRFTRSLDLPTGGPITRSLVHSFLLSRAFSPARSCSDWHVVNIHCDLSLTCVFTRAFHRLLRRS